MEQNNCKYCRLEEKKPILNDELDTISQIVCGTPILKRTRKAYMEVYIESLDRVVRFPIKYCPVCGRKLI